MCPCVRLSVRAWPQQSPITFEQSNGSLQSFQGPPNSPQVIFWIVNQALWPSGSDPDPKKFFFSPNLSRPTLPKWAVGTLLFYEILSGEAPCGLKGLAKIFTFCAVQIFAGKQTW